MSTTGDRGRWDSLNGVDAPVKAGRLEADPNRHEVQVNVFQS